MPAWSGVLGDALTSGALGYTRALLEQPEDEEKRAEREQKR